MEFMGRNRLPRLFGGRLDFGRRQRIAAGTAVSGGSTVMDGKPVLRIRTSRTYYISHNYLDCEFLRRACAFWSSASYKSFSGARLDNKSLWNPDFPKHQLHSAFGHVVASHREVQ